jgi:hypothetical protein
VLGLWSVFRRKINVLCTLTTCELRTSCNSLRNEFNSFYDGHCCCPKYEDKYNVLKKYGKTQNDIYDSACDCCKGKHKFINVTEYMMKKYGWNDDDSPRVGFDPVVCCDCGSEVDISSEDHCCLDSDDFFDF